MNDAPSDAPGDTREVSATGRRHSVILKLLLGWIVLELLALAGLWAAERLRGVRYVPLPTDLTAKQRADVRRLLRGELEYVTHDPVLGWSIRPDGRTPLYQANSSGLRADRDYDLEPAPGTLRIAAFGDSFTHGDEVANGATWPAQLEQLLPNVEVLNFGVPAYGSDQAVLRYREQGRRFHPHIAVLGVMSENIHRLVNVFRPFYSPSYEMVLTKPRFVRSGGRTVLFPNPLASLHDYRDLLARPREVLADLGEVDFFYQKRYQASPFDVLPSVRMFKLANYFLASRSARRILRSDGTYNVSSEAFHLLVHVVGTFRELAREDSTLPIVLLLPNAGDLQRAAAGKPPSYVALHSFTDGFSRLDTLAAFRTTGRPLRELTTGRWGHYSRAGNEVVARAVADYLRRNAWTTVAAVRSAVPRGR